MTRRFRWPALVVVALLMGPVLLAGCDRSHDANRPRAASCIPMVSDNVSPGVGSRSAPAGASLAGVRLPCFPGGAPVRLSQLGRPAVINLWASWCESCRTELPAIEQYAQHAGSAVLVLGVVTATDRSVIPDIVGDLRLTFPNLYDRDSALLLAVGRITLPVTLFVDPAGRVAHVYNGPVLDLVSVSALAEQYLNVTVR